MIEKFSLAVPHGITHCVARGITPSCQNVSGISAFNSVRRPAQ